MTKKFPELTSFGTLLTFAHSLEETAGAFAHQAARCKACNERREELENCADRHKRRSEQVDRIRRERLNEVVLQPIYGMERARYLPHNVIVSDSCEAEELLDGVAALEERVAAFYEETATRAQNVLGGVERTFKKLARESASFATGFREQRTS